MGLERSHLAAHADVPDLDRAVVGPRDQLLAVLRELATRDDVRVCPQRAALALLADLANAHLAIPGGRRERLPVRREGDARDGSGVGEEAGQLNLRHAVPDA